MLEIGVPGRYVWAHSPEIPDKRAPTTVTHRPRRLRRLPSFIFTVSFRAYLLTSHSLVNGTPTTDAPTLSPNSKCIFFKIILWCCCADLYAICYFVKFSQYILEIVKIRFNLRFVYSIYRNKALYRYLTIETNI